MVEKKSFTGSRSWCTIRFTATANGFSARARISDRLLLVLEGRIQLTKVDPEGLTREVGWLEVGDVAGETGLLVGDFHDVLATADGHARVLYLLRDDFNALLADRPRLGTQLNIYRNSR